MIVDEFIENPKFLSMFADTKIHWGNFLTLLHLLMIKHGERKFHLASTDKREFKNLCSLAGKLELEWKVITGTSLFEYQKQEKPLPQNIANTIKMNMDGNAQEGLLISKNKNESDSLEGSVLSDSNVGKILEYPDCCVKWFVNNQSLDWEEVYAFVMKEKFVDANTPVEEVIQIMSQCDVTIPETRDRIKKIYVNHIAESRNTMPFIFFQPCDVCIGPSSPSRKLNDRYAKFAKEKFPQLYQKIIEEGKKDAKAFV